MWFNRLCTVQGYRPRLNWRLKWSPDSVHQPCLREESSAYLKQGIFPKLTPRYHPGWQPLWLSVKIPCSPLAENKVNGQIWPRNLTVLGICFKDGKMERVDWPWWPDTILWTPDTRTSQTPSSLLFSSISLLPSCWFSTLRKQMQFRGVIWKRRKVLV